MDTVASINEGHKASRAKAQGRKDRGGQETIIEVKELRDRMTHLIALYNTSKAASKDLSDAVKVVAEKSGCYASVVRKIVVAKAGEMYSERKKEAQQLALLFDEIGGAATGPTTTND